MLPGNSPVVILKEGTQRDSGKKATQNNIAAAKAIAEAVSRISLETSVSSLFD